MACSNNWPNSFLNDTVPLCSSAGVAETAQGMATEERPQAFSIRAQQLAPGIQSSRVQAKGLRLVSSGYALPHFELHEACSHGHARAPYLPPPRRPLSQVCTLQPRHFLLNARVKPYVSAALEKQAEKNHCHSLRGRTRWPAVLEISAAVIRRSTFGFELAGKRKDQASQTVLFIDEDGQAGVAEERDGTLDPATQKFEQAYASRSRKKRHLRQHNSQSTKGTCE
ncbi:hypothetical protein NDU88_003155 [Pleurodeles waltl]|uniref:Uncharacterized protein n=1 Tax=Pleurodeles waltl TaxID=8319 RepID=A0AAV7UZT1_PLEWA|nr:hypothetical protein NDU88_003155 [Pleurodeles waltl]